MWLNHLTAACLIWNISRCKQRDHFVEISTSLILKWKGYRNKGASIYGTVVLFPSFFIGGFKAPAKSVSFQTRWIDFCDFMNMLWLILWLIKVISACRTSQKYLQYSWKLFHSLHSKFISSRALLEEFQTEQWFI